MRLTYVTLPRCHTCMFILLHQSVIPSPVLLMMYDVAFRPQGVFYTYIQAYIKNQYMSKANGRRRYTTNMYHQLMLQESTFFSVSFLCHEFAVMKKKVTNASLPSLCDVIITKWQ